VRVLVLEVRVGASVGVSTASTVVVAAVVVVAAAITAVASSAAFNLSHFFRGDAIFLSPLCNTTL
jgi:hypothetical protein|tara:strand:- start:649 stop:843 length:195 start_codon:yes stop_codon:yes gene_type:complete